MHIEHPSRDDPDVGVHNLGGPRLHIEARHDSVDLMKCVGKELAGVANDDARRRRRRQPRDEGRSSVAVLAYP